MTLQGFCRPEARSVPDVPPGRLADQHRVTNPSMSHPVVLGFPWLTKRGGTGELVASEVLPRPRPPAVRLRLR